MYHKLVFPPFSCNLASKSCHFPLLSILWMDGRVGGWMDDRWIGGLVDGWMHECQSLIGMGTVDILWFHLGLPCVLHNLSGKRRYMLKCRLEEGLCFSEGTPCWNFYWVNSVRLVSILTTGKAFPLLIHIETSYASLKPCFDKPIFKVFLDPLWN